MFYFLQSGVHILPEVKEKLAGEQGKIYDYIDHLHDVALAFIPRLIMALLVLLIGLWLIKRVAVVIEKTMTRKQHDVSLRTFIRSLVSIGLKIVLIVTVVGMLGIGTTSFAAILGAAGLAVGLALQGSLSNFAGGVLILIFKPFRVGDAIEAQDHIGEVKEIQIFNTILLTGENKTVILPNGPLSNGAIVNRTRHGSLRISIPVAVNSANNIEKVNQVMEDVMKAHPKILQQPSPQIFVGKALNGVIEITVKLSCLPGDGGALTSELYFRFYREFEKHGIKLPPG